jgi:hypothetical protein
MAPWIIPLVVATCSLAAAGAGAPHANASGAASTLVEALFPQAASKTKQSDFMRLTSATAMPR